MQNIPGRMHKKFGNRGRGRARLFLHTRAIFHKNKLNNFDALLKNPGSSCKSYVQQC